MRPHFPKLEGELLSRLNRALEEGWVTNNGPYVQDFEAVLTKYLRVPTICFSSGMTALTAMLMAHDVRDREVIIPAFTFAATPNAVLAAGGIPVYADIKPDTLTIDPDDVARKITKDTAAIMAVDVYGISAASMALVQVAIKADLPLLFDSAPSFGTHVMGKPATTMGPHVYSFHATKQLAVGEGGCLSSINTDLIAKCRKIRNFGLEANGSWSTPGINGKMTEISALIGLENMKTFRERAVVRRSVKCLLDQCFQEVSHVRTIPDPSGQTVSWLYCPVLIEDSSPVSRDGIVNLLMDSGIQTRKYYGYLDRSCLNAQDIAGRVIAFPCYESMTINEVEKIKSVMSGIMGLRK